MSGIAPGTCRFCGCTESRPCKVPPYNDGDVCGWLHDTTNTVCTAPTCMRRWSDVLRRRRSAQPRRLGWAEIEQERRQKRLARRRAARMRQKRNSR